MDPAVAGPDEYRPGDRVIYLHTPDGIGRSKLAEALAKPVPGVITTTRNWNTMIKLAELTARHT